MKDTFSATPSLPWKCENFPKDRGLVRMSSICSLVWMYYSFMVPLWTMSLIKWYVNSICLDLSWKIRFFMIFKQLWLLQLIIVVSNISWNNPDNNFLNNTPPLEVYLSLNATDPLKYLSTCLETTKCLCLGLDMN